MNIWELRCQQDGHLIGSASYEPKECFIEYYCDREGPDPSKEPPCPYLKIIFHRSTHKEVLL